MAEVKTCRTCKYLRVFPNKSGKRIPRRDNAYSCEVEIPSPVFPASVTGLHDFRWPPPRCYMSPDSGEGCPLHESITLQKTR